MEGLVLQTRTTGKHCPARGPCPGSPLGSPCASLACRTAHDGFRPIYHTHPHKHSMHTHTHTLAHTFFFFFFFPFFVLALTRFSLVYQPQSGLISTCPSGTIRTPVKTLGTLPSPSLRLGDKDKKKCTLHFFVGPQRHATDATQLAGAHSTSRFVHACHCPALSQG